MYISRGIDKTQQYKSTFLLPYLKGNSFLKKGLRKLFLKKETKLIISERIVEIPFIWKYIFRLDKNSKILEIGCYGSEFPMSLSALGHKVCGVDIRNYPLNANNFKFHEADASNLKNIFGDNTFDLVFSVSVLEHVGLEAYCANKDLSKEKKVADEMFRVLKPNGTLLITIPFGKAKKYDWYRVYDYQKIKQLFGNNLIDINVYSKKNRFGYWEKVTVEEGEEVQYSEPGSIYPVECVACIVATK